MIAGRQAGPWLPGSADDGPSPWHPSPAKLQAQAWAEDWERIDLQLSPLGLAAIDALSPAAGDTVLDIGCGAGQTLLQLAERVGPEGRVTGVDIAGLLLDVARERTLHLPQVRRIEADAQVLPLPDATADAVFSRFGVMGLQDPVAAFANLRRILRPAGRLGFVCWRAFADNELDHLPMTAAGFSAPVDASPFSLSDPDTTRRTLAAAGFTDITITAQDALVSSGGLEAMTDILLQIGPLGRILRGAPDLRALARPRLRNALAARGDPRLVQLQASVWIVIGQAAHRSQARP